MRNLYLIAERMKKRESEAVKEMISRIRFDIENHVLTRDDEGFIRVDFMEREEQWISEDAFIYNVIASPDFCKRYRMWSEYARYFIHDFRLRCA